MKVRSEKDILELGVRKVIITEIMDSQGVKARKLEHEKRHEVYKDRTREYVLQAIRKEMGAETVLEMEIRTPNINITKKVVKKKARVYKDRPNRTVSVETAAGGTGAGAEGQPAADTAENKKQSQLEAYCEELQLDAFMKDVNRATELHRNVLVQILPHPDSADLTPAGAQRWTIDLKILRPNRFDVIEDPNDPKEPMAVILSYFDEGAGVLSDYRAERLEPTNVLAQNENSREAGKAQTLDTRKRLFVWWSRNYHFTTDESGAVLKIVDQEEGLNPFKVLPFVSFAKDQTEGFWSDGGEGQADNAILINLLLADLNYASKYQGTGLGWMSGDAASIPANVYVGPTRFVKLPYREGEPEPKIGFASSNPNLKDMLDVISQQLGFFLTSEDLEPGAISGNLDANNAASGIQEIIQKAEPMTSIEDDQQLYKDKEPQLMEKFQLIAKVYQGKGLLCEDLDEPGKITEPIDYDLTFTPPEVVMSEGERVDVAQKKKNLGLYTEKQILADLHPDLTGEALDALILELKAEREAKTPAPLKAAGGGQDGNGGQGGLNDGKGPAAGGGQDGPPAAGAAA